MYVSSFSHLPHEAGDSEALAATLDAGAAASRRARVPQVSASLRKVAGLRRSQRSRDAREGRREESAGRMQSHRMSQSSWGFEYLVQVCQMVRSRRDRSAGGAGEHVHS